MLHYILILDLIKQFIREDSLAEVKSFFFNVSYAVELADNIYTFGFNQIFIDLQRLKSIIYIAVGKEFIADTSTLKFSAIFIITSLLGLNGSR